MADHRFGDQRLGGRVFAHLAALTDDRGVFEHADGTRRRIEHGYCTDDNARMLLITSREPDEGVPARLSRIALAFTLAAQAPDGRIRNRLDPTGEWLDQPGTDDCWGRSVWAFGVAARRHGDRQVRQSARVAFDRSVRQRSAWPRSMAFAALGAADAVIHDRSHSSARALLRDAVRVIGVPTAEPWMWPEDRLTYANATLAEALIAAGSVLGETAALDRGLGMLRWLLRRETRNGHLSPTGTSGADLCTSGAQFDQQPIEVAALADACWRAHQATGDQRWRDGVLLAAKWFTGANDVGAEMHDPGSEGGYDGLTPTGPNLNQGAESTMAFISTIQRAHSLRPIATRVEDDAPDHDRPEWS